jgi:SNF2 family DNA or RNA helicase
MEAYTLAVSKLKGRLIVPYQREGVVWMLLRELQASAAGAPKGGFLCDEMGLGKTVQVISTMLGNPLERTLVIVPKSIVTQWKEEIEHFAPQLKVYVHDGPKRTTETTEFLEADVTIAPYSVMVNHIDSALPTIAHQVHWNRVVLDEGHEIRSPKSKICRSVMTLKSDIRWIITGTPIYNSMRDFVTLCAFVGISKQFVQGMSETIRKTYLLRRTKEDVAKFNPRLTLPKCDFENVELEMYPEERELYKKVFTSSCARVKNILKTENVTMGEKTMDILECLLRCRQVMIHPQLYYDGVFRQNLDPEDNVQWLHPTRKMDTLFELVKTHPAEKSLVFCMFSGEMQFIKEKLEAMGKAVFQISGSVPRDERVRQIKNFKKCTDPNGCVFIIQIKAGGQGLNLQEATRVYIMAPSWNPATEMQAIARSHRTGQTKKVVVRKLIYSGEESLPSVEQSIMNLQGTKASMCSQVLNDARLAQQIPTSNRKKIAIHELKKIFSIN